MKYSICFTLPGLPKSPNELLGAHWRIRSSCARKWLSAVNYVTFPGRPKKPLGHAKVTLTRVSSHSMDRDNLRSSFKPILDALVKCGILEDDTPEVIGEPEVFWEKGLPKKGFIKVKVEEL